VADEARIADGCPTAPSTDDVRQGPTLVDLDEFSSLCSTGHTPQILTGAILRILQNHFSSASYIEDPALKDNLIKLQPDDTTEGLYPTGILIEPIYKWNPAQLNQRIAIYIKRNPIRTQRYGIDDGLTTGLGKDNQGQLETLRGDYHTLAVLGSHTLFCIGRTGAETEVLAYEVFRELVQFGPAIRRDLKLHRFGVTEMTDVSRIEEYDQHFVAGIVVGWAYFETWRIIPDAPWLKTLVIDLRPTDSEGD
jgi:hypothetical protein